MVAQPGGTTADGLFAAVVISETSSPTIPDALAVSLSNSSLTSADLTGLPSASVSISLAANMLPSLDLSPLASCAHLTALILNGNSFTSLDLSPLANLVRLERLWLHNNALTTLDLTPLSGCTALRSLYLDANKLDDVPLDLAPLAFCRAKLRALRLSRNKLAGELDITPLLQCGALRTLDTCASVKLTARTDGAAPTPLPPALRRRAATVHWTDAAAAPKPATVSAQEREILNAVDSGMTWPRVSQNQPSLSESESLEELAKLCREPLPVGVYSVVIVGFRRNCRFAIEQLLQVHGDLATAVVASPLATSAASLEAVGALSRCGAILVRSDAVDLIREVRRKDSDLPIVVVGGAEEKESAEACVRAGGTLSLYEPLGPRDAITVRHLAQERVMQKRPRSHVQELDSGSDAVTSSPVSVHALRSSGSRLSGIRSTCFTTTVTTCIPAEAASSSTLVLGPHLSIVDSSSGSLTGSSASSPSRFRRRKEFSSSDSEDSADPADSPASLNFTRLRARTLGLCSDRSSRVEESAISMVFTRCGARLFPADFSAITTLCGIPLCASSSLHAAVLAWSQVTSVDKHIAPAVSPVSIIDLSNTSKVGPAFGFSESFGISGSDDDAICDKSEEEGVRQSEGVTYSTFKEFWTDHLMSRDGETRLFNVLRIAHKTEGVVSSAAVGEIAAALVSKRSSIDMKQDEMAALAVSILCYEIKGGGWNWMRRQELSGCKLSQALLAAESGMFDGVAANLRADRMADMCTAFAAASGKRTLHGSNLSVKDVAWLNRERGLLSRRAVVSVFDRAGLCHEKGMTLAAFAPMWLAVSNPSTRAATEYLFGLLDVDVDGYLTSADVAHFYAEKRDMLREDGFVPIAFEHVWRSLLDSVGLPYGRSRQVSVTDIKLLSPRDRKTLFQSLLFLDDGEMAMVDLRATAVEGSISAKRAVAVF